MVLCYHVLHLPRLSKEIQKNSTPTKQRIRTHKSEVLINSSDSVLIRTEAANSDIVQAVGYLRGELPLKKRKKCPPWVEDYALLRERLARIPDEFERAQAATVLYRFYILGETDQQIWEYCCSFPTAEAVREFRRNLIK